MAFATPESGTSKEFATRILEAIGSAAKSGLSCRTNPSRETSELLENLPRAIERLNDKYLVASVSESRWSSLGQEVSRFVAGYELFRKECERSIDRDEAAIDFRRNVRVSRIVSGNVSENDALRILAKIDSENPIHPWFNTFEPITVDNRNNAIQSWDRLRLYEERCQPILAHIEQLDAKYIRKSNEPSTK